MYIVVCRSLRVLTGKPFASTAPIELSSLTRLHELHPETKTFCWHEVSWVDQKSQSAQLKIPEWTDWITDYFNVNRLWLADLKFSFPVPLSPLA